MKTTRDDKQRAVIAAIVLSDDEEDLGERIPQPINTQSSPDPLTLRPMADTSPAHAFDAIPTLQQPSYVDDPPSIDILRERSARRQASIQFISDSEKDEIEDFPESLHGESSGTREQTKTQGHGSVKSKVSMYEARESQHIPHINFAKLPTDHKRTMTSRMKPKSVSAAGLKVR